MGNATDRKHRSYSAELIDQILQASKDINYNHPSVLKTDKIDPLKITKDLNGNTRLMTRNGSIEEV